MANETKRQNAYIFDAASREYRAVADQVSQACQRLGSMSDHLLSETVSGPPADYLRERWEEARKALQAALDQINQAASGLASTASNWQTDYQNEKRQEEEDTKRREEQAKQAATSKK